MSKKDETLEALIVMTARKLKLTYTWTARARAVFYESQQQSQHLGDFEGGTTNR